MANAGDETETTDKPSFTKVYMGQYGPSIWRDGMEVGNPLRDGLSAFDCFFVYLCRLSFRRVLLQYPISIPFALSSTMPSWMSCVVLLQNIQFL